MNNYSVILIASSLITMYSCGHGSGEHEDVADGSDHQVAGVCFKQVLTIDCFPPLLDYSKATNYNNPLFLNGCCRERFNELLEGKKFPGHLTGYCVPAEIDGPSVPAEEDYRTGKKYYDCGGIIITNGQITHKVCSIFPTHCPGQMPAPAHPCDYDVDIRVWRDFRGHHNCTVVVLSPCLLGRSAFDDDPIEPEALNEYETMCEATFSEETLIFFASVLPENLPWHDLFKEPAKYVRQFTEYGACVNGPGHGRGSHHINWYAMCGYTCPPDDIEEMWCKQSLENQAVCAETTWEGQMREYIKRYGDQVQLAKEGKVQESFGSCKTKVCPLSKPFDPKNPWADPQCPIDKAKTLECNEDIPHCACQAMDTEGCIPVEIPDSPGPYQPQDLPE